VLELNCDVVRTALEEEAGNDECNHATLLEQECWTFSE
jgi:hypothetical protein